MRRRQRWVGLAWLQQMADDSGLGVVRDTHMPPHLVANSLHTLIHDYRRYVDFEKEGDACRIRVMPRNPESEAWPLNFGCCYVGKSLPNILTTAAVEMDMIAQGTLEFRVGSTEKWRWVP